MIAIITAASFGFALHAAGYLAVSQEIDRISERYHPIGSLSSPDGIVTEGVALVAESPYVELADVSRTCPAILSDLYNVDLDGKSSDDGTERNGEGVQVSDLMVWGKVVKEIGYDEPDMRRYVFRVEKSVYGYPEYAKPGKQIILEVENAQKAEQEGRMLEEGKTYLVKGYPPKEANNGNYGEMMIVRLEPLEEGVLFWEGEPDAEISRQYVDEYDMLQERNRHALVACTTKDMSAMPQVQESARDFYLEEGRWLDRRDQEEGRRVCVVMKEFANIRSLSVGDTLTLTLQDKMLYYMGYSTSWNDTWETADKTEVTLEIVGIYGRLYGGLANSPSWAELTVRNNFIYIPDSSMPEHYAADQEIWQDSFSFVLNDPKEKEVFVSGITQKLAAEGLSVNFAESNWDAFYRPARAIRQGERNSFLLFTTVAALLLGVVAFSYGWQRKREIAIARAAGIPAKTTAICASVPMLVFGTGSILAGGILGWDYGLRQAERTLAKVEESSRTQLSALWMAGICLALWLFLVIVLLGGIWGYTKKTVLELLQGGIAAPQKKRTANPKQTGDHAAIETEPGEQTDALKELKAVRHVSALSENSGIVISGHLPAFALFRFVGRHLRRFSLRSVCALLMAAVFTVSSCLVWEIIRSGEQEIERLYRSTVVEMEIMRKNASTTVSGHAGAYIRKKTVQAMLDTGNVSESYLVAGADGRIGKMGEEKTKKAEFIGIVDIEQYLAKPGNGVQVHFGGRYGADLFGKDYTQKTAYGGLVHMPAVILPKGLYSAWGAAPGDLLYIGNGNGSVAVSAEVGGYYTGASAGAALDSLLVPMSLLTLLEKEDICYLAVEFTLDPEKNRELESFREMCQTIIEDSSAGLLPLSFVIWDGELRQAVEPMERNLSLMRVLYPLANTVFLFAAAGLSVLFLFQRRREAAVLRVLGVGCVSVRLMLALELLTVDLAGVLLGTGMAAVLSTDGVSAGSMSAVPLAAGCCLAGCLIGITAGVVMVTARRPLELLNVKE